MNWTRYLTANPQGVGDPVTAFYLPEGFVLDSNYVLAKVALQWFLKMASPTFRWKGKLETVVNEGEALQGFVKDFEAHEHKGPRTTYDPFQPTPLFRWNSGQPIDQGDTFTFELRRFVWFSRVRITIRPYLPSRDGPERVPPLVLIEWDTLGTSRDARLLLPETFGAIVRHGGQAWTNTESTGLTTLAFRTPEMFAGLHIPRRWEVERVAWDADVGGVVCFGTSSMGYLVTLPKRLQDQLIERVQQRWLVGGESFYLEGYQRHPPLQNLSPTATI